MVTEPGDIAAIRFLLLGWLRGTIDQDYFPILLDHVEENFVGDIVADSFTVVTKSGFRFKVSVEQEEVES